MKEYEKKRWWKVVIFAAAFLIGIFSLWYTRTLVKGLAIQEEKKIVLWANATKQLSLATDETDINFLLDIIKDNETIPTILVDDKNEIISHRNLDSAKANNPKYLNKILDEMKAEHEPIKIDYDKANNRFNYLYYKNSNILNDLKTYPFIQLSLIAFFAIMSYLALSSSRRAEQNQVWVGMSKETAHQLGTPISSLREWHNLLRETDKENQEEILKEVDYDIRRLELITERFSKIGSEPILKEENLDLVIEKSIGYLKNRVSSKVDFTIDIGKPGNWAKINIPLFDWVIENLCKNAIDAMEGNGSLRISINHDELHIFLDITDTGKGIPKSKFKTVFKPGFTTKKRGWGLGLSLVKRIIHQYHKGQIYVRHSELGKGTTFRIVLDAV
ncbi:MAG: HAMP domain-containing histidine kinase [Bacteroidia bacterium]|nr:HAMP domain-containing histidine kinase [Bacteroidia bacterium]MCF8427390.1 HAMP domain-containing histidine kinase [Bacteroidia bacterium]MCF8446134.1 HAMP domain-containing histidine kinase [Bacteroidia bacterium]